MGRIATRFVVPVAFVITASMMGAAVEAAPKPEPAISSATVSADQTTLFVDGEDLGPRPDVMVGDLKLSGVVVDAAGRRLSALLPSLAPGTYLLQVTVGKSTAQFVVALGISGAAGPEGPAGADGPAGESGEQGPEGAAGPAGPAGDAGSTGARGPAGNAGPAGATGQTGAAGPIGAMGPAGATGSTGAMGSTGATGAGGATGEAGAAGPTGAMGPAGAMGPVGAAGSTGAAGPAGSAGAEGPAGPAGLPGPTGSQGAVGSPGSVGPAGVPGPTGPAGPMPNYYAGWVLGTASVRFGSGFTVTRLGVAGSYQIALPAPGLFHATTVTPSSPNVFARISLARRDALSGQFLIDVEIRSVTTGSLVDGEFNFIALMRS